MTLTIFTLNGWDLLAMLVSCAGGHIMGAVLISRYMGWVEQRRVRRWLQRNSRRPG